MGKTRRQSHEVMSEERTERVREISLRFFGRLPKRVAFPGGKSRSAFVVDMGDGVYIFADRKKVPAAQLEGIVLKSLGPSGQVPKLVGVHSHWVVQECMIGERMPVVLDGYDSMDDKEALNVSAIESLITLHDQAADSNLSYRVPKLGQTEGWLKGRIDAIAEISKAIDVPTPLIDRKKLYYKMDVKRDEFVKWDARPGNALVTPDGVSWFDWEDCGRSKSIDDLAFLLLDEWNSIDEATESRLLDKYLPTFCRSQSLDEGSEYFRTFGVTHCVGRLKRSLRLRARKNKWWDRDHCLQADKVGVTPEETGRLLTRIRRYSDGVSVLKPLPAWVERIAEKYAIEI